MPARWLAWLRNGTVNIKILDVVLHRRYMLNLVVDVADLAVRVCPAVAAPRTVCRGHVSHEPGPLR